MFLLTSGASGSIGPTGGEPVYGTSREGGTEETVAEGVESGAGAYAGPNMAYTRPLTNYYVPESILGPVDTVAPPAMPQGPNPYADTLGMTTTAVSPQPPAAVAASHDCGCGGNCDGCNKLPWYVLVGLVVAVVLLLRD